MHDLVEKNSRGLIQGPDESEEAFLNRCRRSPKSAAAPTSPPAKALFDVQPDWVQLRYSDQRLHFWEGGCTWIEGQHVTVQLRKAFQNQTRYLGYSSQEIIAHELVHVVRSHFEEPIFEEVLAYQSSRSRLRRYFGPLFRSSKESLVCIIALFLAFSSTLFGLFQPAIYLGVFGLLGFGVGRLIYTQWQFAKARAVIEQIVGVKRALAVLVRLTDREMIRFSRMEKEQVISYAIKMSRTQLRWQQIRYAYFK